MAQKQGQSKPVFLNLDASIETLQPEEALRIHNYTIDADSNGQLPTATGNGAEEGQNELALKPIRSNKVVPNAALPAGFNKHIGSFYSVTTQELYHMNYNSNGQHGVYVLEGDTMDWKKVAVDPELGFSDNPEAFIAGHRVTLRATYDENKQVREKHLIFTDGNGWQKWINVNAAIQTDGFNTSTFPYWRGVQPHFDRRELFEYAVRPPMYKPEVSLLPNTNAQRNIPNRLIDKWFRFAYQYVYTDGRKSLLSPWSNPMIVKSQDYLANPQFIPKRGQVVLNGGNCLVEKVVLYVRVNNGDWYQYDSIDRFGTTGVNDPSVIGDRYWLRSNPYDGLQYDPIFNTFRYEFLFDKVYTIVSQESANFYQNALPIKSVAQSDLGDSILYSNNLHNYNNLPNRVTSRFSVGFREKQNVGCQLPLRKVRLYAIAVTGGRDNSSDRDVRWLSQVGYQREPDDKVVRFGGLNMDRRGNGDLIYREIDSELYSLNFGDKKAFRCYLKGTEYYSDGVWYICDSAFGLTRLDRELDISKDADKEFIAQTIRSGAMFVCVFDFLVPAGVYSAAIGRHDVNSSDDYRSKSTYVFGLASSRRKQTINVSGYNVATLPTTAILTYQKEMEVNCISADYNPWGSGSDMFYIFSPYTAFGDSRATQKKYKLLEGYFKESPSSDIPVERFNYTSTEGQNPIGGLFTDKNGFFWMYTYDGDAREADVSITGIKNCGALVEVERINTSNGNWAKDLVGYLDDGTLLPCNWVTLRGRIQDATGTIGYSNVGVSIYGGATAYTDLDGNFSLRIHNGAPGLRQDNVYVNSSGSYIITLSTCAAIPPYSYREPPCSGNCSAERVVQPDYNLSVVVSNFNDQTSVKNGGKYPIGIVGFDLAGRGTRVAKLSDVQVSSFLQRNNSNATELFWSIAGSLRLPSDMKWIAFYVAPNITMSRYVQWVGDYIEYIDSSGNVTKDENLATFVRIGIESLLESNIRNNFSLLTEYQFVRGDRMRVIDNGEGVLLNTTTFGEPIDVEVYGTTYNEAAANAGLINQASSQNSTAGSAPSYLMVRYDKRLNVLKNKTGFWIELYRPALENEQLFYGEVQVYPVINGEIAVFAGMNGSTPVYTYPTTDTLAYWDTYFVSRAIAIGNTGTRAISHPFESPNVTDFWGRDAISSGRVNVVDSDFRQMWYRDESIKSDDFLSEGVINGLGLFRDENRKEFKGYAWGGIVATIPQRSIMAFVCENDWFLTDFNLNYAQVRDGNFVVVNLGQNLSEPRQKIGDNFGCSYDDTQTVVPHDNFILWHDAKSATVVLCNYSNAIDLCDLQTNGRSIGIKAYYQKKSEFRSNWNKGKANADVIDVSIGVDIAFNNIFVTYRPRRNNSTELATFVSNKRGYDIAGQETFVFDLDRKRWVRTVGFAPEGYAMLRGRTSGKELITFAKGIPYVHNHQDSNSFCVFYGIRTERHVTIAINDDLVASKVLQSVALDSNRMKMFVDMIYGTEPYAFSRIPANRFILKDGFYYAEVLRDESSFPSSNPDLSFRSMLIDGKAVRGVYFVARFVGDPDNLDQYQELNMIYFKYDIQENSLQK